MARRRKTRKAVEISHHVLIPKHVKLSDKEKKELLERYDITLNELPKILKDDPAVQELNVKPGDVVKIIRKSATSGEAVFYRSVTNV